MDPRRGDVRAAHVDPELKITPGGNMRSMFPAVTASDEAD